MHGCAGRARRVRPHIGTAGNRNVQGSHSRGPPPHVYVIEELHWVATSPYMALSTDEMIHPGSAQAARATSFSRTLTTASAWAERWQELRVASRELACRWKLIPVQALGCMRTAGPQPHVHNCRASLQSKTANFPT